MPITQCLKNIFQHIFSSFLVLYCGQESQVVNTLSWPDIEIIEIFKEKNLGIFKIRLWELTYLNPIFFTL